MSHAVEDDGQVQTSALRGEGGEGIGMALGSRVSENIGYEQYKEEGVNCQGYDLN